jgi:hypothetical protein
MPAMATMMQSGDPVTSIPLHRSTLQLLQRVKTSAETWDDFLISLTDDYISPALRSELDRRLTAETIVSGRDAKREFLEMRRSGARKK